MRIRKTTLTLLLGCLAVGAGADVQPLAGFKYGVQTAPTGKEWESPQDLGLNKEQPHAWFFSFADFNSAQKVLPTASSYWKSLDGQWKFNWAPDPAHRPVNFFDPKFDVSNWDNITVPSCWNVVGLQKDGSQKYGTPIYCNQPVIFKHSVAVGDWKGGVMREPNKDWTTYKTRNEVGSYRRTFDIPANWDGREVYVNFDGVNSFFYLYINGKYVGFSKNSRNTATFNITPYLNKKGENVIAAEVYRSSDGSFLESQDMFRLPGIFRSVTLTSKPQVQVRDLVANPSLSEDFRNGKLNISAYVNNLSKKALKGCTMEFTLNACKLYADNIDGSQSTVVAKTTAMDVQPGATIEMTATPTVGDVKKWSAEEPYRYILVGQLKDKKGNVLETVSTFVGFRQVEIKDTPASQDEFGLAGRYYYVNGMPIKLKGVNRQEINPATGNTIDTTQIKDEIFLMKRGNINHVRCSHYSNTPYWYYYCDKYGIYLEDEANLESHEYYYGDASLSHVPEFKDAHVGRVMELVHAHVNNPSVVIWSLGNEAGPGKNFVAAYNAIKQFDLSRPVQYERNNDIVDMGSNQYPGIDWVREAVKGKYNMKYPFHISEYAHSMGNAGGNLVDYWKAMESTNYFCGGAIWDWVDQALYTHTPDGTRYLGYGGDFGDKPNDGMFCMNGILFPEHDPKPEFAEVKKVYQNVGVSAVDMTKGQIEIFNKNYFIPLNYCTIEWSLWKDGKEIQKSTNMMGPRVILAPRMKQTYTLPYDYSKLDAQSEYFVKVQFLLANDEPWAKKGFVQMEEQLPVKAAEKRPSIAAQAKGAKLNLSNTATNVVVKGQGFEVSFDKTTGSIASLSYNGKSIITPGNGPVISALRAPTDNDNWAYGQWFRNGLHNLKQHIQAGATVSAFVNKDGSVVVSAPIVAQAPNGANINGGSSGKYTIEEQTNRPFGENDFKFTANQIYTVYPDGSIELQSNITGNNPSLNIPRLGYEIELPTSLSNYKYYGRGPWNNYADRKSGYFIEQFNSTVKDQFVHFPKPQSMGNREDVRWCALTGADGTGVQFIADGNMSASALPYSQLEMTLASHPYQLPASTATHLHLDCAVTGLGGNSCGQGGPLGPDCVKAGSHNFGFIIRPVASGADLTANAAVTAAGEKPIGISRDRKGEVTITSAKKNSLICYRINNGKPQIYNKPFSLRAGGNIVAWEKNSPLKTSALFSKIESIPLEVVSVSSQETGEGNASHLVDGDPSTIWHTMYSVTVGNYPHNVVFDANEVKNIKGFTYMPRQDASENGDIKAYKLEVSLDGKTWTDVTSGSFERNKKEKKILFKAPVKARYVRFTGLSSQNGADYGGGAEFSLLVQ